MGGAFAVKMNTSIVYCAKSLTASTQVTCIEMKVVLCYCTWWSFWTVTFHVSIHIEEVDFYRPRSEASKGYVFTGICPTRGGEVGDQGPGHNTPPGDQVTTPPFPRTMRNWAVCILLECILVFGRFWFPKRS